MSLRKGGGGHGGGNTASPGGSREGGEDRFSLLSRQLTTVITTCALCNYEISFIFYSDYAKHQSYQRDSIRVSY